MIGVTVGSYRVVRKLGEGGMGEVWLAEHVLLGQKVAIKFLHADITKHEGIVKRFFDEARAASQIADPGIVAVIDFGWHERGAYIIMEYLAGESLSARMRAGRMPIAQALRVAQQLALTMAVAHGRGIIHRDLKPDNVFLVADAAMPGGERVKILDFGIAKLITEDGTSQTRTDLVMGTPSYMSPEQCRGAAGVDHRTDIYALGCIAFHMLCGRLPFDDKNPGDMIASQLMSAPPIPSTIEPALPAAVDTLLACCLAKDPGARFQTMTELARAFAEVAGTPLEVATIAPVLASQRRFVDPARAVATTLGASAAESVVSPRPRRTRVIVATALSGIAALATLVIVTWPRAQSSRAPSGSSDAAVDPPIDTGIDTPVDAAIDAAVDGSIDAPRRKQRGSNDAYKNR